MREAPTSAKGCSNTSTIFTSISYFLLPLVSPCRPSAGCAVLLLLVCTKPDRKTVDRTQGRKEYLRNIITHFKTEKPFSINCNRNLMSYCAWYKYFSTKKKRRYQEREGFFGLSCFISHCFIDINRCFISPLRWRFGYSVKACLGNWQMFFDEGAVGWFAFAFTVRSTVGLNTGWDFNMDWGGVAEEVE